MNILNLSAIGSLIIQLITGIIEFTGLKYDVEPEDEILKDTLRVELVVQIIEFIFYFYLVYKIIYSSVSSSITSHRYFDWSITTPVMLVNFVVFFKYLNNPNRRIKYLDSINEDFSVIRNILIANFLMLYFGYQGEIGKYNINITTFLGFIPFIYMFKQIYKFVNFQSSSYYLYLFVLFIWSLYGVAALFPFAIKNTFYNILDLFSKNAFGLLLYYFIRNLRKTSS